MVLFLASCESNEQPTNKINTDVYYRINSIINNPTSYNTLIPKKINPFDQEFENFQNLESLSSSKIELENEPSEEIVNASDDFKNLNFELYNAYKKLISNDFIKLAYAIELVIIEENISAENRQFILKNLSILKLFKKLEDEKDSFGLGNRIMCNFECRWNRCMNEKLDAVFSGNWIDIAWFIASAAYNVAVMEISCAYDAMTNE
jgi:hypothetical protein